MPPTAILGTLESLRRRVRVLGVFYGLGIAVAAAMGLLLATCLLDYLLDLPPIPRILVMLIALGCLIYVLARRVVRPGLARLGLSDVAGKLENAFPDFDDRLRSSVNFVTSQTPGSQVMQDRVLAETAELAQRFDLGRAVQTGPVWHSFAGAAGAIAFVMILAALLGQDYLRPAISRLLTPFEGRPWPKRVEIKMVDELPQRVAAGQPIEVQMRLAKGDSPGREARLYCQYGDGRADAEIMSRGADGVYSARLDARLGSAAAKAVMTVWIAAGDDSTVRKMIAVVPRLAETSAQLTVTPPPYVDEPPRPIALDAVPATVTYGSSLAIRLTFNKELDGSRLPTISPGEQGGTLPAIAWDKPEGDSVIGRWIARGSAAFQVRAYDMDGFANADVTDYQVIVRPDQPPSVQITRPARNEECTPQAVIPLRGLAEDDFGISTLKLVVVRLGQKPTPLGAIDLIKNGQSAAGVNWSRLEAAGDLRRWQLDYPWDLSQLAVDPPLKPGDFLEYHLEAQDNFAFEGQTHAPVSSGKYRIAIMSQEQFSSLMRDLVGQVREQIKLVRGAQRGLKDETADLLHQTAKQPQFTAADRQQADELVARQTTAASQVRQAASRLDELAARMEENKSTAQDLKDLAANVRDSLNQVAEHPMKDAAAGIDDAKDQKPDPQQDLARRQQDTDARNKELASAGTNQQNAVDQLDEMISRMGDAAGLEEAIGRLKDMLDAQRQVSAKSNDIGLKNIGKRPDQMDPADQKAQQANADAQAGLSGDMARTMDKMAAAADQLRKSDPASSQAMQQAVQTGQQQGVAAQMQSSADAQRQNQQSSAQQAQTQIEIGLQMMIHQLEQAQQRKLAALAKQLADMQEQIANLLRQQGSLNYNNLSLQGGKVLAKADAKVIAQLLDFAGWTTDHIPPVPDLDTQTRLQAQAERNTRGVAESAQSLPDGAGIAAALGRAANRMGRAISALRGDQVTAAQALATAYDPPQVEALDALEKAKELIDAQAAKNAADLQQQKKDAIRAVYQKVLESQRKIDADTLVIDKAPRSPDGQLGHRDAIVLGQLPGRQDDLAGRIGKLDDELASLNSIVYVWANHDIAASMKDVEQALSKPSTGTITQAQQTRIEEQLQAMIESLAVKPKKVPFAKPGGGGKGGGGNQPLPTEAELRLMKRLQEAVNKATQTIAGKSGVQNAAVASLGGRQGQLRDLLDALLKHASNGKMKLGPEPDRADKLPEEAAAGTAEDQALEQNLLNGDGSPNSDQMKDDIGEIGRRMGRSHQRLAQDRDPGAVTQAIQKGILKNLDALIEMARAEEAESKPEPGQKNPSGAQPADANAGAQPGNSNAHGTKQASSAAHTPAAVSAGGHDVDSTGTPTIDITQSLKEWGSLSPRKRAAVIEAASEKPVQKFKEFIDDYYQALGNRPNQ